MRAKRVFIVLGPGLVASLVLSPGIAAAASAAPAPARVAVAAPSISGPVGQAAPPAPYPSGYSNGLHAGIAAAEAGKPRSAIPLPLPQATLSVRGITTRASLTGTHWVNPLGHMGYASQ